MTDTKIAIFKGRQVRKTIYKNEWWFSLIDVVEALTGTDRPRKYWNDLKKKLAAEGYRQVSEKIGQLKLMATDGKYYLTDCADTETMFRIIQSIPSPKAEPFKRWLARVGGSISPVAPEKSLRNASAVQLFPNKITFPKNKIPNSFRKSRDC